MHKICMDIDNVIARTDEVMREVIREHSMDSVDLTYEDIVHFDYWKCEDSLGRSFHKSEWEKIHEEFTRKYLPKISPYENARECLIKISERFEIHLATSRLKIGRKHTVEWLAQHDIPYRGLHFVTHREKHRINHDFIAAVDDDIEQGYLFHNKGIRVFLYAHPWNSIDSDSPLVRVADWHELTNEIIRLDL